MPERPILLTGFMGCGKSSVGLALAGLLGCRMVDLDSVIVEEAGRSINEIFSVDGEAAFRVIESDCLKKILHSGFAVVSTGGGVVIADKNRYEMRKFGRVVNLTASLPVILDRLKGATDRPLYSGEDAAEQVSALMQQREQFYAEADIRIDTVGKSVEDVAAEILRVLKGLCL